MTKKLTKMIYIVVAILAMSCSKNEDNNDNAQPLYWEMEGQRFTAQGGKAYEDGNFISVYITPDKSDCSSDVPKFKNYLNIIVPKNSKGEGYNVIFQAEGKLPMNSLNNEIRYENNEKQFTIWIKASTRLGHKAEGKYTVPYCK